jgi:hypothetical protein
MGRQKKEKDDDLTQSTASESSEASQLVERQVVVRKVRRTGSRKKSKSLSNSTDFLSCLGCCGAMDVMEPEQDDDPFADDDGFFGKVGHSILQRAGFAPPVRIIKCSEVEDDSVITTPRVLEDMARQYDREQRFWKKSVSVTLPNDANGVPSIESSSSNMSSSNRRKLIPSVSMPSTGRTLRSSLSSRSGKSIGRNKRSKKERKHVKSSKGRFEI